MSAQADVQKAAEANHRLEYLDFPTLVDQSTLEGLNKLAAHLEARR